MRFCRNAAVVLIACVVAIAGCSKSSVVPPPPWLTKYHGQSKSAMLQLLGEPANEWELTSADVAGEFQIEIWNTYPPDDPVAFQVPLHGATWHDGDDRITLWYHTVDNEWVVFESCRWHKDIVF